MTTAIDGATYRWWLGRSPVEQQQQDPTIMGFILDLKIKQHSPETVRLWAGTVRRFQEWMGGKPLSEATRSDTRAFLADTATRCKPASVSAYRNGLRAFFGWLVREGDIPLNPTTGIDPPRVRMPDVRVLSEREIAALLRITGSAFIDTRDRALLRLLLDCGLRRSEATGLAVDDVTEHPGVVVLRRRKGGASGLAYPGAKTNRDINRYLRARATHRLAHRPELWLSGRGVFSPGGLNEMVGRRGAAAGIDGLHAHVLRHTWAHHFLASGGQEGDAQILGGWSSREQLSRYGRGAAQERAAAAATRLSLGDRV